MATCNTCVYKSLCSEMVAAASRGGESMKFVIKSHEKPGFMIAGIGIGLFNMEGVFLYGQVNLSAAPITWTQSQIDALKLEEGEALAAITFISDVIDWELAESLYAEQLKES